MKFYKIALLAAVAALFSACNVTKHLDEAKGERLLVQNSIELKTPLRLKNNQRVPLLNEFGNQYKQVPNRRPLILFRQPARLWFYHWKRGRDSKFARWVERKIAEPPVIYDELITQSTVKNFQNLARQRGYFDATSSFEKKEVGKYKAKVKYILDLGVLHTINEVEYESRDEPVEQILREQAGKSLLKRGEPLDGRIFDAEKARITNELRNRGYAYFAPNFVAFSGDSIGTQTNVTIEILTPNDTTTHQIYTIGNIEVLSSVRPGQMAIRRDTAINGIFFRSGTTEFGVKPSRLYKAIAIKPLWPYHQADFENTIRHLNELGVFRFVSVKPVQDSIDAQKINVEIITTPNKRISLGADVDLNSSTSSSALARNLLGISASGSFRNRNLFRGAENLHSSLQYNIEFDVATRNRLIFSQEFKWQNQLSFPRFFDYFGMWRNLQGWWKRESNNGTKSFYRKLRDDSRASLSLNYNYLNVIDFYDYNLFNSAFGYDLNDGHHRYSFDHIGIDVLRPRTQPQFDSIFGRNQFLINSFGDQLFTGIIMRAFTYNYLGSNNRFGERWYYRFSTDISGLEELALNRLWSAAFGKQEWTIADLDFAQYFRAEMDGVYTRDFRKNLTGAVRVGAGVVVPFGDTKTAPFVKQFFVGGPASIRAWRIREIGPGGFVPRDDLGRPNPPTRQPFYQAADFRFEFNGELRFDIFSWFKGAVFLDGGNIWTLQNDTSRPGSQLRFDSYKNIAIGTGLGIRGDFSYLVIRFDAGLALRNPYADERGGYWVRNFISGFTWSDFNPNLAVGLPF